MNLRLAIAMTVFILASCGLSHHAGSSGETRLPRTWFLVVAPFTREFPGGDMHAPIANWPKVTTYDTSAACDAILIEAENNLQRPVQCVASDDPRLNVMNAAR